MKQSLSFGLGLFIGLFALSSWAFAASSATGGLVYPEDAIVTEKTITYSGGLVTIFRDAMSNSGKLAVLKLEILDDADIQITFNTGLAEEPVNLKLYETEWSKPVTITSSLVESIKRENIKITLGTALVWTKKYTLLVNSARAMNGSVLEQKKIVEWAGFATPNTLPASNLTKNKETTPSFEEALKKAVDTGVLKSTPSSKDSNTGSISPSASPKKTESPVVDSGDRNSAPPEETWTIVGNWKNTPSPAVAFHIDKKLPQTGPEVWIFGIIAIIGTLIYSNTRRKRG